MMLPGWHRETHSSRGRRNNFAVVLKIVWAKIIGFGHVLGKKKWAVSKTIHGEKRKSSPRRNVGKSSKKGPKR